MKALEVTC